MSKNNQKKRWFEACLRWLYLLGMGRYELVTNLDNINEEDEASDWRDSAKVETRARYRSIRVTGDKKTISEMSDADLDETACHEIIHAVLAPLVELLDLIIDELPSHKRNTFVAWRNRESEEVTTHLTVTVRSLHKAPKGKQYEL